MRVFSGHNECVDVRGATREVAQRVDEVCVTQRALHDHTALRILLVHHRVSAALNLLGADADPA